MAGWQARGVAPADVVAHVRSGHRLYLHGDCAASLPLEAALAARAPQLGGVRAYQVHKDGPEILADPAVSPHIRLVSLFCGAGVRAAIAEGRADYVPVHLSDIPRQIKAGRFGLDVAIVQLSWPDADGWCSLGVSVDSARAAVDTAPIVLAELNRRMPRTHGASRVHLDRLTAFTVTDRPLLERVAPPATPEVAAIGAHVAALVPDEATLQAGIGGIPNAVLAQLTGKRDLGLHTEMFSDAAVALMKAGVITHACKTDAPGQAIVAFVAGTRATYDYIDDNPRVVFRPTDETNAQAAILRQHRMTSINAALEVDLTGQVCSDSLGERIYSGFGGQVDFVRAAALAPDGKAILALPATAKGGTVSRISAVLAPGAGVVTTRAHVQWVVTEFGAVDLSGATLAERADRLIAIAHPDHRADLRAAAKGRKFF